jgi:predicted ATPase/DNA-binding winged helix-turn-helix (wHTH) protein
MRGSDESAVSFGPFRLNAGRRLLEHRGEPVHIGDRALDILIVLAERAGEVVSKKDLVKHVWFEVNVDEGSLRFHMAALRKVLGDGSKGARYVVNVRGRGYSLVAPVSRSSVQIESGVQSRPPEHSRSLPPPLAKLVGRDESVQTLIDSLSANRFVTLVGPGGIGKTTVATAVGHALLPSFDGQVSFVDLGPLADPRLVASVVASALGQMIKSEDPIGSLVASMRDARLLLILDGCEHVIEPIAVLAEALFRTAPSVHIFATSREVLRAEGEQVHRLLPLRCPPQDKGLRASDALSFSAAQLFVARVIGASAGYRFTDAEAPAVADICNRLDGIPLALEIAAGRADALGIKELAARLDDRLLLTTKGRRTAIPRHQTLRATLDWSYERLPKPEQLLLSRLSIFHGVFTLSAASAVCSMDGISEIDIPQGIFDLVAKSLVANIEKEASYRLLDTTRYYAREKLESSGERPSLSERHAMYVCRLFELAAKEWEVRPSSDWLATYRTQIDNVRAALKWAFSESGDPALGIVLTIKAVPLWSQLSLVDESLEWVERALTASANLPDRNRRNEMQLYAALGGLQMYAISSVKLSNNAWDIALNLATDLGDTDYQLRALRALWAEAINSGEFRHALSLAQRFAELAGHVGTEDDQIVSDRLIGTALHFMGEQEKAHAATERMLERYVASAARTQVVRYQFNQKVSARIIRGRILWMRGQTETALRDIEENVAEALTLEHTHSLCNVLTQAACPIALLAGEFDIALRYVDLLREYTAPRALDVWHLFAVCYDAGLDIERNNIGRALDRLQPAMEELRRSGFSHFRTTFLMMRARALLLVSRASEANTAVAEAIGICERTGERWCLPELHRLTGEIALIQQLSRGVEAAVEAFQRALILAREQRALAWELRAATSLARCLIGDQRIGEALTVLRRVYEQFPEGYERPELMAAAAILSGGPSGVEGEPRGIV